jgi:hypothetical protein
MATFATRKVLSPARRSKRLTPEQVDKAILKVAFPIPDGATDQALGEAIQKLVQLFRTSKRARFTAAEKAFIRDAILKRGAEDRHEKVG